MAEQSISLKLLVNKTSNTVVVFAESGPDFVDVLLSFLTFPIAAIAHLTSKQSSVGCIDKLYESVERLNEDFFMTKACKNMLLPPRNSSADQCKRLKINIDCTEDSKFYICSNICCSNLHRKLLSTYANCKCLCGRNMDRMAFLCCSESKVLNSAEDGVFAKGKTFLIRDDLTIDTIYPKLDISDWSTLEEKTMKICRKEVLQLFRCSFISIKPLTDILLQNYKEEAIPFHANLASVCDRLVEDCSSPSTDAVKIKLVYTNQKKLLYAEANSDFVDILFNFLTLPLGSILRKYQIASLHNLYISAEQLSSLGSIVKGNEGRLLNPKLPKYLGIKDQVIVIEEEIDQAKYFLCRRCICISTISTCYCYSHRPHFVNIPLGSIDPKTTCDMKPGSGGYCNAFKYMITDNLVVTPFSLVTAVSLRSDNLITEEMEICVGEKEALALLKASLTSRMTALSDAFLISMNHSGRSIKGHYWRSQLAAQTN